MILIYFIKFILILILILAYFISISSLAIYSILSLILIIILTSMLLWVIGIEFIALMYIIVYLGAIAVLFLFIIMMINLELTYNNNFFNLIKFKFINFFKFNKFNFFLILYKLFNFIYFILFLIIIYLILNSDLNLYNNINLLNLTNNELFIKLYLNNYLLNLNQIAELLYIEFSFLLIISAYILLVAMIGTILLTLSINNSIKKQNINNQTNKNLYNSINLYKIKKNFNYFNIFFINNIFVTEFNFNIILNNLFFIFILILNIFSFLIFFLIYIFYNNFKLIKKLKNINKIIFLIIKKINKINFFNFLINLLNYLVTIFWFCLMIYIILYKYNLNIIVNNIYIVNNLIYFLYSFVIVLILLQKIFFFNNKFNFFIFLTINILYINFILLIILIVFFFYLIQHNSIDCILLNYYNLNISINKIYSIVEIKDYLLSLNYYNLNQINALSLIFNTKEQIYLNYLNDIKNNSFFFLIYFFNSKNLKQRIIFNINYVIINTSSTTAIYYLPNLLQMKIMFFSFCIFLYTLLFLCVILYTIIYLNKDYNNLNNVSSKFKKLILIIIINYDLFKIQFIQFKIVINLIFVYNIYNFYNLLKKINLNINNEILYLYLIYIISTILIIIFMCIIFYLFVTISVEYPYFLFFIILIDLFLLIVLYYLNYKTNFTNNLLLNFISNSDLDSIMIKNLSVINNEFFIFKKWPQAELLAYLNLLDLNNNLLNSYTTEQLNDILLINNSKNKLNLFYNQIFSENKFFFIVLFRNTNKKVINFIFDKTYYFLNLLFLIFITVLFINISVIHFYLVVMTNVQFGFFYQDFDYLGLEYSHNPKIAIFKNDPDKINTNLNNNESNDFFKTESDNLFSTDTKKTYKFAADFFKNEFLNCSDDSVNFEFKTNFTQFYYDKIFYQDRTIIELKQSIKNHIEVNKKQAETIEQLQYDTNNLKQDSKEIKDKLNQVQELADKIIKQFEQNNEPKPKKTIFEEFLNANEETTWGDIIYWGAVVSGSATIFVFGAKKGLKVAIPFTKEMVLKAPETNFGKISGLNYNIYIKKPIEKVINDKPGLINSFKFFKTKVQSLTKQIQNDLPVNKKEFIDLKDLTIKNQEKINELSEIITKLKKKKS